MQNNRDSSGDKVVMEPYTYIDKMPGKKAPTMVEVFNFWMKVPQDKLTIIKDVVRLLHEANLMINDVQNNPVLKRGMDLNHPKAKTAIIEQLQLLKKGQDLDIGWRKSFACPTVLQYRKMIELKAAGVFGLIVRLMQLFSDFQEDMSRVVRLTGLFLQITDDYNNLTVEEFNCSHLTEGRFSYPTVYSITYFPEDDQVLNILKQKTTNTQLKKKCLELLEKQGAIGRTQLAVKMLDLESRWENDRVLHNPLLVELLDTLNLVQWVCAGDW